MLCPILTALTTLHSFCSVYCVLFHFQKKKLYKRWCLLKRLLSLVLKCSCKLLFLFWRRSKRIAFKFCWTLSSCLMFSCLPPLSVVFFSSYNLGKNACLFWIKVPILICSVIREDKWPALYPAWSEGWLLCNLEYRNVIPLILCHVTAAPIGQVKSDLKVPV